MVAMGKGGKKTPDRVVKLINEEVEKLGQNAAARAMKLPLYSVQKYMAGIAEPTQASLQKLADYFEVSVSWLRGGNREAQTQNEISANMFEIFGDLVESYGLLPLHLLGSIARILEFFVEGFESDLNENRDKFSKLDIKKREKLLAKIKKILDEWE
jgi:transcriptional regulator with XRE-family HTH domain